MNTTTIHGENIHTHKALSPISATIHPSHIAVMHETHPAAIPTELVRTTGTWSIPFGLYLVMISNFSVKWRWGLSNIDTSSMPLLSDHVHTCSLSLSFPFSFSCSLSLSLTVSPSLHSSLPLSPHPSILLLSYQEIKLSHSHNQLANKHIAHHLRSRTYHPRSSPYNNQNLYPSSATGHLHPL